jgi:oligopeptide transport system substrate-binding protein
MPGYNTKLHGIENTPASGDLNAAKADWAAYRASRPGENPTIKLSFNLGIKPLELTAEALQATWSQLFGVDVQIDQSPWKEMFSEMQLKKLQVYPFAWLADYPDPEDFLTLLFASDSPFNDASASIAEADLIMKQADGLRDLSQRLPLYAQAEQMLIDQVAVCPLFQFANHYRLRRWVKGDFVQDAQGEFPNDAWISGYIARH